MRIHREGRYPLLISFVLYIALIATFAFALFPLFQPWHLLVYSPLTAVLVWVVYFFRDPIRQFVTDPNGVISPADGTIVIVEQVDNPHNTNRSFMQVSIFMSPLNVHVNRYPVDGTVLRSEYYRGKYLVAWHPKSSTLNERTCIELETPRHQTIIVAQIAGFLARRIVCYAKKGDKANQGQELGFIKFGSRVDLFLPPKSKILVKRGDKVKGGLTRIAMLP